MSDVDQALLVSSVIGTVALLAGTTVQVKLALQQLTLEPLTQSALAIDDLRSEVPRWRPFARRQHRATLRCLIRESPAEAAAYKRLIWSLRGWALMWMGSLFGVGVSVVTLVRS